MVNLFSFSISFTKASVKTSIPSSSISNLSTSNTLELWKDRGNTFPLSSMAGGVMPNFSKKSIVSHTPNLDREL